MKRRMAIGKFVMQKNNQRRVKRKLLDQAGKQETAGKITNALFKERGVSK